MTQYDDQNPSNRNDRSAPQNQSQEHGGGRDPSHIAYAVKDQGRDKKSIWTRIGASWPHRDGDGMDVQLDATPVDGRLTLRAFRREEYEARRAQNGGQSRDRTQSRDH
mmetsp:Transcript_1779/g.3024  ORF Transcript_1779/g.3024 Transcript_1779/m.3024 type:complete len:108 (-) Transcript_1779:71-394(-)